MSANCNIQHRVLWFFWALMLFSICTSQGEATPQQPLEREGYFYIKNHYITYDIYDQRVSIPDMLSEGKSVLLELCGIWSVNGQAIHKQGMLQDIYATYGPKGSKELEVIWVNTDSTSIDEIQGFSWYGAGFDWTDGGSIPYPILNTSNLSPTMGFLWTYLPKFYLIEPSGWCIDVTPALLNEEVRPIDNYIDVMRELLDKQVGRESAPIIESITGIKTLFVGEVGYFEERTRHCGELTSISWTAEGYSESSNDKLFRPIWTEPGTYEVELAVANAYGHTVKACTVTVLPETDKVLTFPAKFGFDDSEGVSLWRTYDQDEDGHSWLLLAKDQKDRISAEQMASLGGLGGSADALVSYSYYMSYFDFKYEESFGYYLRPEDWLISPTIVIPQDATTATLSYLDGYFYTIEAKERADGYKVMLSESGVAPEDFKVTLFNKPSIEYSEDLTPTFERTIDLSAYAGKSIRIAFVHPSRYSYEVGTGVIIDEVTIISDGHNPSPHYTTDQPYIEVTTARSSGQWDFKIDADEAIQDSCWADLNGNGLYDAGEEEGFDFRFNNYRHPIDSKRLRIYGDFSQFECSFQQITAIDLSQAPNLTIFVANYNQGLDHLDLSHNELLTKIEASGNDCANIILGKKPLLKTLDLNGNQLKALDLHEAPLIERVDCFGNIIEMRQAHDLVASLPTRSVESPGKLFFIHSTYSDHEKNQILVSDVLLAKRKNWEVLDFNASKPYEGIDNMRYTTDLPTITLYAQDASREWILQIDLPDGEARDSIWLDINDNKLFDFGEEISADLLESGWRTNRETAQVTLYGAITSLKCQDNGLVEIDCSANDRLKLLDCSKNMITQIKLGEQYALTELYCYQNQLGEIDLTKCPNLKALSINDNQCRSLDLSGTPYLESLMLSDNEIASLDLSMLRDLRFLACDNNHLSTLDLSTQTKLETLYCEGNQISALDLTTLTALRMLSCIQNQLTTLDLSTNKAIEDIYCYDNAISATQMKTLFSHLPDRTSQRSGKLYAINSTNSSDRNRYNEVDLPIATAKNWIVNDYMDGANGGENPLSLESVVTSPRLIPHISDGSLSLTALEPYSQVILYTLDGSMVQAGRANDAGSIVINIKELPMGCYILSVGTYSVRVML